MGVNIRFGRYEVVHRADGSLDEIGRGAMGVTYRARDTSLKRTVVLKVLNENASGGEGARKRFLREAAAAAQITHPHIAAVHDIGEQNGVDYYVMEYIDGETLEQRVHRAGPMTEREVRMIARQVAGGLADAARRQLVHRDLKPANLMLVKTMHPGEIDAKIIDFGLAKQNRPLSKGDATLTAVGQFVGSPVYASPEQLEGRELDSRSDLYSLGITLWNLLTGELPFVGSTFGQIVTGHLMRPPPLERLRQHRVSEPMVGLIARLLSKERDDRPADPEEFLRELDEAEKQMSAKDRTSGVQHYRPTAIAPPQVEESSAPKTSSAPSSTNGLAIAGVVLVVIALALGALLFLLPSKSDGPSTKPTPTPRGSPTSPPTLLPSPTQVVDVTPAPTAQPTARPTPQPTPTASPAKNTPPSSRTADDDFMEAETAVAVDPAGALSLYKTAAERGSVRAMTALGAAYCYGVMSQPDRGGPQTPGGRNFPEAKRWLEQAVAAGDIRAKTILGNMYLNAFGVAKDVPRAIDLLSEASEGGYSAAKAMLAFQYAAGIPRLVKQDQPRAATLITEAAKTGDTAAQSYLGFWHLLGYCVPKDSAKGLALIQDSIERGSVLAQYHMGLVYSRAYGVPKDEEKAVAFFRAAARLNVEQAQEELRKRKLTW